MKLIQKNKEILILLFLLGFSAFFRLYRIADYMTFLGDEGRDVLVVYNMLHGDITFLGPTMSVGGFFLGPFYYYLMTPFLWLFNYNPVGPAVMVALFSIATVILIYKIGSEFFGKTAAFIAAILYSISPLVISYSRSSWNPNVMPFFTLVLLYVLYKALQKNSWKLFFVCGILYGILMQFHYVVLFVAPVIMFYTGIVEWFDAFKKKITVKEFITKYLKDAITLFIGFLVGMAPFLAFEIKNGFPNVRSIFLFITKPSEGGGDNNFFQTVGDVFFRMYGRLITKFPPPEQISVKDSQIPVDLFVTSFSIPVAVLFYFTVLIAIPCTVYVLYLFIKAWKKKSSDYQKYLLIIFWFVFGVVLFGFYKKSIYDYYFEFMFPVPFLLFGAFFSYLYFSKKIYLKILASVILVIVILLNLSGNPFRYEPNRQLQQVRMISESVYQAASNKPYNFALGSEGNSDHAYRYFLTLWGNPPVEIKHKDVFGDPATITDQLLVVCERPPCHPLGDAKWEIAGFGKAEIAKEWDVSVIRIYKLVPYKEK